MTERIGPDGRAAIVGMAVILPGAGSLATYWRNLVGGVDAITQVPANRWDEEFFQPEAAADRPDRVYCRRGGFIDEFAEIDPMRFGIMPASVPDAEPDQLIALRVAAAAIDDAGGVDQLPAADRIGVVLGHGGYQTPGQARLNQRVCVINQLMSVLRELLPEVEPQRLEGIRRRYSDQLGRHQPEAAIGLVPNLVASRVANRLDLRGPAYAVDAACASALLAVDQAVAELASGRCDAVLAGGVHHCHDILLWSVFSQLKALSRQGESRPFDRGADGLLIGEGTGVVMLKRLADALRDGDRIYAVVRGTGVASDGRTASLFNPDPSGQALAIRRAWAAAGLQPTAPDALGLLEAHGTATPAGDRTELTTVAEVFGPPRPGPRPVIGSVKSMIGHTMPAAGIAGLVKAALAVYHGVLLPTLHCDDPRPELATTRFAPLAAAQPWDLPGPRRAGVNAFGFGGINAHVLLEQVPQPAGARSGRPRVAHRHPATVAEAGEVLWLHQPDIAAMARLLDADDQAVRAADIAGAAADAAGNTAREPGCRLGIVGPTAERLATARRIVARGQAWHGGRDIWFSLAPLLSYGGRVAYVFPGLEADFVPRVDDVAAHFGLPRPLSSGQDITWHAAAVFEVSRLLHTALDRLRVTPDAVAGHSLGEWTAMAAAGMFSGGQVEQLLASIDPGRVQVPGLVFAAVGASAERTRSLLADHPDIALSHDNAPAQCIICGPEEQVRRMVTRLQEGRILSAILPFRSGFHTPMFQPYLASVRSLLELFDMHPPVVPVWSATAAAPFPGEPGQVRELFLRHLVEPVRFRQTVTAMHDAGIRAFLQVGTGKLASVMQDILRGRDHLAVPLNVPHRSGLDQLRTVATALWVAGGTPDRAVLRAPAAAGTGIRPAVTGAPVKLDLGGALVRLGDGAAGLLGMPALRAAASASPATPGDSPVPAGANMSSGVPTDPLDRLRETVAGSAAAAELAALLQDTAHSALALLGNGTEPTATHTVHPAQIHPGEIHHGPEQSKSGHSGPLPGRPGVGRDADPLQRTLLYVSTATMPYLLDHCLFPQRADWPHTVDRWPVVPATTMIRLMTRAAESVTPGTRAVAVHNARFEQWLIAAPPVDVELRVNASGPGRYAVRFGPYARATIEVAGDFPADRPPVRRPDPATERPPEMTAGQLYAERWLFHGPQFQGLTQLLGLGEWHVRAMITAPAAPGSLLDNVGQVMGYWMQATQKYRILIFPVGIRSIRFFGPRPRDGQNVECVVHIRELTDSHLVADAQLIEGDRVWAEFEGWTDRRFDSHPRNRDASRFPQRHVYSDEQPEGWAALFDRWPDLATRELLARQMLGKEDRAEYEQVPPRDRRQWLLGRIVTKDVVRFRLWANGASDIYPAEVRVVEDPTGRLRVHGWAGYDTGDFDVSLAHCAQVAVAIARSRTADAARRGPGVGIAVREIRSQPDDTPMSMLSGAEQRLIEILAGAGGPRPVGWLTRFWVAKEAVARAESTAPVGDLRRFAVVAATDTSLTIDVDGQPYWVGHREFGNPDDLPERRYVVAWTWGPATGPPDPRAPAAPDAPAHPPEPSGPHGSDARPPYPQ